MQIVFERDRDTASQTERKTDRGREYMGNLCKYNMHLILFCCLFLVQKLLSIRDERGQPCSFYALASRSMKALVCLLDHSTNTDSVICANGESLLHAAAKLGCIHLTRMLLAREILSTLVDHVEKDSGQAPLHIAAKYNHVEVAKEFLLYGAKIDRQDLTGSTPIFTAASKGHSKMLKVFLQHTGKVELTCR